jgi:hypothetical protein
MSVDEVGKHTVVRTGEGKEIQVILGPLHRENQKIAHASEEAQRRAEREYWKKVKL